MSREGQSLYHVLHHDVDHTGDQRILRRIVSVDVVADTHPPERRVTLNCGHAFNLPRGLRPTVGKLTPCPECR